MSNKKILYLWVEGPDDDRFFSTIVRPLFEKQGHYVIVMQYSRLSKIRVDNYLDSITSMNGDYLYIGDLDELPDPSIKIEKILSEHEKIEREKICAVCREIESWYLAGLDFARCNKMKIKNLSTTDDLTKEHFNKIIPRGFDLRTDFLIELLKKYEIKEAIKKNKSFDAFIRKYKLVET